MWFTYCKDKMGPPGRLAGPTPAPPRASNWLSCHRQLHGSAGRGGSGARTHAGSAAWPSMNLHGGIIACGGLEQPAVGEVRGRTEPACPPRPLPALPARAGTQ